jgi:hypothetical protein
VIDLGNDTHSPTYFKRHTASIAEKLRTTVIRAHRTGGECARGATTAPTGRTDDREAPLPGRRRNGTGSLTRLRERTRGSGQRTPAHSVYADSLRRTRGAARLRPPRRCHHGCRGGKRGPRDGLTIHPHTSP